MIDESRRRAGPRWWPGPSGRRAGSLIVAAGLLLAFAGCAPVADVLGGGQTPHETYAESLREAGLADRALGAAWLAESERALAEPLAVTLPFRETGFFAGDAAEARGYRIATRRGERLVVTAVAEAEAPARLFMDLFTVESDRTPPWAHEESADTVTTAIRHTSRRDGMLIVRLQPELLRAVRYTLTIQVEPSLAFPVDGHDAGDIRSAFGVDRDGGRRVHHGVDIFAPRGTPVLAAAEGLAEPRLNRLGGNVVWQRVPGLGSIYYAHLDSQAVVGGTVVRPGDTIGFVGNTGNAVTTPPHLHFGIYARPGGPVDPFPFIYEPEEEPPEPLDADVALGIAVRTVRAGTVVREGPGSDSGIDTLPAGTVARLAAGAGNWRRIVLPDGRTGFVGAAEVTAAGADQPLRDGSVAAAAVLRARPDSASLAIAELPGGTRLDVLGTFEGWQLVVPRDSALAGSGGRPVRGWIPSG